ncbi:hypothetical protein [Shouchella miscanthi]|uniref:hypothetical protein n=1 Tax=Shouchella miscanthi TaxID=2598861 RepID=UPI0011A7A398|nr:hypothetical protein [Shouchella miscanthi]
MGRKTKADLAFSHPRLGSFEPAKIILREIEEWTQQDNEYHAKTLIYQNIYIVANVQGFGELIQHELLYFDAGEVAVELVSYYEEHNNISMRSIIQN